MNTFRVGIWRRSTVRSFASLGIATVLLPIARAAAQEQPSGSPVVRFEVHERKLVGDGARTFGDAGEYAAVRGTIHYAFDPAHERNAGIHDLALAPKNAGGLVEASADVVVLHPVDPAKGCGTALLEVSNRGGMASMRLLCRGRGGGALPTSPGAVGDALLLRLGMTVVWVGWQQDVERGLALRGPTLQADAEGEAITGSVRCDWVVDEPAAELGLGHMGRHRPYPIDEPTARGHVLTRRSGRDERRVFVPRGTWSFRDDGRAVVPVGAETFPGGYIYELVYSGREPTVTGLGFLSLRAMASFLKHDARCSFGAERVLGIGISQTGRLLRHFLWAGQNLDVASRPVFDGVLIEVAGAGRGSFNHRFAQPSRDAHRYRAFVYPTDVYPFASEPVGDPRAPNGSAARRGVGLLDRQRALGGVPKIFQVNTGYEYWGRAAGLIHTNVDGSDDVAPAPEERLYHIASAQHFVSRRPRAHRDGQLHRSHPLDFYVAVRSLLVALKDWVERGVEPPPSAYPRLADDTLVAPDALTAPAIPGVRWPTRPHVAYRVDYGDRFESAGIVDWQPPRVGDPFPALVPAVDEDGNERGGVRTLEVDVPLATYLPWFLRADGEIDNFVGTWVPLPRTATEGDPRRPIDERYASKDDFLAKSRAAAVVLVERRWMLAEDVDVAVRRAEQLWDLVHSNR